MHISTKKNLIFLYKCFMVIGGLMFCIGLYASGVRALDSNLELPVGSPWNQMTIIGLTGIVLITLAAVGRYRSKVIEHFL